MFKDFTGKVVIPLKSRNEVLEIWCIAFWLLLMHKNCTGMARVIVCICKIWDAVIYEESTLREPHKIVFIFFLHVSYNLWMNKFLVISVNSATTGQLLIICSETPIYGTCIVILEWSL